MIMKRMAVSPLLLIDIPMVEWQRDKSTSTQEISRVGAAEGCDLLIWLLCDLVKKIAAFGSSYRCGGGFVSNLVCQGMTICV